MDFPSVNEEIDRKTLEELERILFKYSTRDLTKRQALSSFHTLWNTVAGIVPKETMELLSQTQSQLEREDESRSADQFLVLSSESESALLIRNGAYLSIYQSKAPMTYVKAVNAGHNAVHPALAGIDRLREIAKVLVTSRKMKAIS